MIQTWAMFKDAYRELNYRKLFWVTLALSLLGVLAFAAVGIDENGITIFHWSIELQLINTKFLSKADFYKLAFSVVGVQYWLGWFATILAIISTASIFPDFIGSGSIDLILSKPISRVRLFLTKYLTGLLFVTLQVSAFTFACILVIGIRGDSWEPWLLVSIPLLVIFYSYLFCVQAVVGMLTRSPIASIIAVGIFWMVCFGLQTADGITLVGATANGIEVENTEKRLLGQRQMLEYDEEDQIPERMERIDKILLQLDEIESNHATWVSVNYWVHFANTLLPKTGQTNELLLRTLKDQADLTAFEADEGDERRFFNVRVERREVERRLKEIEDQDYSWTWVIGSSLAFEVFILSLGCWWFVRRDF